MSQVIVQPAGQAAASIHWVDTIEHPVSLQRIKPHVSPAEFAELTTLYPEGRTAVWGVTPGGRNVNEGKWLRMQQGDVVLFAREGGIAASAVVTWKTHSKSLAVELWKTNRKGATWEYVYCVDEVLPQNIPYKTFNEVVRYKRGAVVQGFNVLDAEKSAALFSAFDLGSSTYFPPATQEEFERAVRSFDPTKPLDAIGTALQRTEQGFLRSHLLSGKRVGTCGLCGQEYPVGLLVTAHIKKRSRCSTDERLDHEHVVMPMCLFGCDALYERGYLCVIAGKVTARRVAKLVGPARDHATRIDGFLCPYWNERSRVYFDWHAANVAKVG